MVPKDCVLHTKSMICSVGRYFLNITILQNTLTTTQTPLEYLTKVYSLPPPSKVNTAVFKGKWRRVAGKREVITFRHNDWKKAFVMWKRWPGEGSGV